MGVSNFAGIPGTDNLAMYDVCGQYGIRPIVVRNEMFAPMLADGYSRVSRKTGVVLTIPGPGALATLSGLLEAHACAVPQLMIATDIPREHLGQGRGHLHEVIDLMSAFRPVTDKRRSVSSAGSVNTVAKIIKDDLRDGSRTILLHVPADVYGHEGGVYTPSIASKEQTKLPPATEKAIAMLKVAKRPVIFAGAGVWWADAIEPLRQFAHELQAPVFTSVNGKGVMNDADFLSFGQLAGEPELRECIAKSDLAILIGTRWTQRSTDKWSLTLPDTVIEINMREIDCLMGAHVNECIIGDAKAILGALVGRIGNADQSRSIEYRAAKGRIFRRLRKEAPLEMELLHALRKAIPDNAIVVNDSTVATYWTRRCFPVLTPGTFLWPMGSGTIGWALPAALGARLATQEDGTNRPVIALIGDGGFQFSMQELGTMMQENLPVVIVLFDDSLYGVIRHFQKQRFGKETAASALKNPYFAELAHAYKMTTYHAPTPAEIGSAITRALGSGSPSLIHCPIRLTPPERL